jgi:hypothetical protein
MGGSPPASAAIGGAYLQPLDRQDAIKKRRLTAYKLARRKDVGNYQHLLARTLKWDLFRDCTRPGTDAMDRSRQFLNVKDLDSLDATNPLRKPRRSSQLKYRLRLTMVEGVKARIKHLIGTRVLPRLQLLAPMMFLSRRMSNVSPTRRVVRHTMWIFG